MTKAELRKIRRVAEELELWEGKGKAWVLSLSPNQRALVRDVPGRVLRVALLMAALEWRKAQGMPVDLTACRERDAKAHAHWLEHNAPKHRKAA